MKCFNINTRDGNKSKKKEMLSRILHYTLWRVHLMIFSIAQSVKVRVDLIKLFAHFCTECKVSEESAFDQVIKT